MKFRDVRRENQAAVEGVCLILSLAAIFFQIWVLASCLEAHFQGHDSRLLPAVVLSFMAFAVSALTAWTTGMPFMPGIGEGRTETYYKQGGPKT